MSYIDLVKEKANSEEAPLDTDSDKKLLSAPSAEEVSCII
jgi:hypothetical protein